MIENSLSIIFYKKLFVFATLNYNNLKQISFCVLVQIYETRKTSKKKQKSLDFHSRLCYTNSR